MRDSSESGGPHFAAITPKRIQFVSRPSGLTVPTPPSVGAVQDLAAVPGDPKLLADTIHGQQLIRGSAPFGLPVFAAVGGMQNHSAVSNCPELVTIGSPDAMQVCDGVPPADRWLGIQSVNSKHQNHKHQSSATEMESRHQCFIPPLGSKPGASQMDNSTYDQAKRSVEALPPTHKLLPLPSSSTG